MVCAMSCFDCVFYSALFAQASINFFFIFRLFFFGLFSTASTRLISTGLGLMVPERQHRSESKSESESESESGSLLVSSRNDSLGYDMWWQERQNEMWLRLDVDFILAGCEDAVVVTARGTVDGDADIDGYVEYERNLIDSALELLASSQAVPLQLQLADCRDGDGAPRIDSDK